MNSLSTGLARNWKKGLNYLLIKKWVKSKICIILVIFNKFLKDKKI